MNSHKQNLFIYGSLRDPSIFKSVSSLSFTLKKNKANADILYAEPAMLAGHRKISPDNVYFYAVQAPHSKIEGFIVYHIPKNAFKEIDRFEGKKYTREKVRVNTANGPVKALAYLACRESMKKDFGDRFHVNLIHELWLRKRIEKFINRHTRPGERSVDAKLERKAQRQFLATTERDLVMSHYRSDAMSDYYLEHELNKPVPSIKHLVNDENAQPYINNYLALVVKQCLLNELDDQIQSRFRYDLEHMRTSQRYYSRSRSLLAALQMLNANKACVDMIIAKAIDTMNYTDYDLIDYVKYAIKASDSLFETRIARSYLERIWSSAQIGIIPLGAETELSNLGAFAVEPQRSLSDRTDEVYNNFEFFSDFKLDVLSWKLGGYIDDHTDDTDAQRKMGFFELALGRLNIAGELSRPATADPWLLNALINEIVDFYDVEPHSLHLSFQMFKKQVGKQKILPLSFVKCLLVLGGGLEKKSPHSLLVSRVSQEELITQNARPELAFARTSKRQWYLGDNLIADKIPSQAKTWVQQYKFIRLSKHRNYEPLILGLKGLQIQYNPADYLTFEQMEKNSKLRKEYDELKQWSQNPTQLNQRTINRFCETIYDGLMKEAHTRPAHKLHYIDWAVSAINMQLKMFNEQSKEKKHQ